MDKLIANDTETVSVQLLMANSAPFTHALRRISGGSNQEVLHICLQQTAGGALHQMCSQMVERVRALVAGGGAHASCSSLSQYLLAASPLGEGASPAPS